MKYIKFKYIMKDNYPFVSNLFFKLLYFILPSQNPGLDKKNDEIYYWLLEFAEEDYVEREIGLNNNHNAVIYLPSKTDYGFWIDVDMTYNDFLSRFECEIIDENEFEFHWNKLNKR